MLTGASTYHSHARLITQGGKIMAVKQWLLGIYCLFIMPALSYSGIVNLAGGDSVLWKIAGIAAAGLSLVIGGDYFRSKTDE